MTNSKKKMICVIGLGNALRGDAVVANYINNTIEAKKYNVTVFYTQQPDNGWAEKLKDFVELISECQF